VQAAPRWYKEEDLLQQAKTNEAKRWSLAASFASPPHRHRNLLQVEAGKAVWKVVSLPLF